MTKTLWFALLAGHVAWSVHILVSYFLAWAACASVTDHWSPARDAITLGAGAATLAALAAGYRAVGPGPTEHRFVAGMGVALSAIFLFAIAAAGAANLLLPPCA